MKKRSEAKAPSRHDRRKALEAVAGKFDSFRPAREVLTNVKAVPTIFPQFDHGVRVGGWPIERYCTVHGESNEGKTIFTLGIALSFLKRDHLVGFVDAERTTPFSWTQRLMGAYADHPGFRAMRPETYEQTIADVRNFLNVLIELKESGEIDKDTSALVVVDSLRKLVPKEQMKEILEAEASEAEVKGGRDRSAQLKAKMNAAWMDELVPLLEKSGAGFIGIAREMKDPDADIWARKFGTDYKVAGGGAIIYDASLVCRIDRAGWVEGPKPAGGGRPPVYGERHRVTIRKTKVAGKDMKQVVSFFHTSNGTIAPEGFDLARDVLELALQFKVIELSGTAYSFAGSGEIFARGKENAVKELRESPDFLMSVEREVRSRFRDIAPVEFDEDGVVQS